MKHQHGLFFEKASKWYTFNDLNTSLQWRNNKNEDDFPLLFSNPGLVQALLYGLGHRQLFRKRVLSLREFKQSVGTQARAQAKTVAWKTAIIKSLTLLHTVTTDSGIHGYVTCKQKRSHKSKLLLQSRLRGRQWFTMNEVDQVQDETEESSMKMAPV